MLKINKLNIVDINNIEDIVESKLIIDKDDPEVKYRSDFNNFIQTYCSLKDIIIINGEYIAFNFVEKFGKLYLFISDVSNEKNLNIVTTLLIDHNYNFNSFEQINPYILSPDQYNNMLIHDNKYFKI